MYVSNLTIRTSEFGQYKLPEYDEVFLSTFWKLVAKLFLTSSTTSSISLIQGAFNCTILDLVTTSKALSGVNNPTLTPNNIAQS